MNKKLVWTIVILVILLALWILSGTKNQPAPVVKEAEPVAVSLNELNKSGQSGTAMLKEVKGKATVVITLNNQPKDTEEPAHIHSGSCQTPGDIKYPLTAVKNGSSETVLDVSLAQVLSELPLLINVHKSDKELGSYVACGDIIKPEAQKTETK